MDVRHDQIFFLDCFKEPIQTPDMNRPLPTANNNHDHVQQNTFKVNRLS